MKSSFSCCAGTSFSFPFLVVVVGLLLPYSADAHFFWAKIVQETTQQQVVEIVFSEEAGVIDDTIQMIAPKIQSGFSIELVGKDNHVQALSWTLEESWIVAGIPLGLDYEGSMAVGSLDYGHFPQIPGNPILQYTFAASQLLLSEGKEEEEDKEEEKSLLLSEITMEDIKEKFDPLGDNMLVLMSHCGDEVSLTVLNVGGARDTIKVCLYGEGSIGEIGCKEASVSDVGEYDEVYLTIPHNLESNQLDTTLYVMANAIFLDPFDPENPELSVAQYSTNSITFNPRCTLV